MLPLPPLARDIIVAQPHIGDCMFTYTGKVLSGFSRAKENLDEAMAAVAREELAAWRLHDLRRTASTMMHEKLGIAPHVVEAVLNHVSGHKAGVAGTYNVAEYREEKAVALARWAAHVKGIVEQRPANVVAIPTRKRKARP